MDYLIGEYTHALHVIPAPYICLMTARCSLPAACCLLVFAMILRFSHSAQTFAAYACESGLCGNILCNGSGGSQNGTGIKTKGFS